MRCPRCGSPMIIVERRQIELDHCIACHGVWFDAEELELLFADLGPESMLRSLAEIRSLPRHAGGDKPPRCPRCRKTMEPVEIPAKEAVVIDRCRHGDGLWFDGGELQQVVALAAGGNRTAAAIAFVRELFPHPPSATDPDSRPADPPPADREAD